MTVQDRLREIRKNGWQPFDEDIDDAIVRLDELEKELIWQIAYAKRLARHADLMPSTVEAWEKAATHASAVLMKAGSE